MSAVEDAAEKAHIDAHALAQARADLGLVTSRGNAGGVMAVQWTREPMTARVILARASTH